MHISNGISALLKLLNIKRCIPWAGGIAQVMRLSSMNQALGQSPVAQKEKKHSPLVFYFTSLFRIPFGNQLVSIK
jgi:hypothetical protein